MKIDTFRPKGKWELPQNQGGKVYVTLFSRAVSIGMVKIRPVLEEKELEWEI